MLKAFTGFTILCFSASVAQLIFTLAFAKEAQQIIYSCFCYIIQRFFG